MSAVLTRAEQPRHRARNGGWRQTVGATLTPIRVETAFWLILWTGLAAGIGLETKWGRQVQWPVAEIAEKPPEISKPALAEPFRLPPAEQYSQMTARPIFIVSRRPIPIVPPPGPPKPTMKKDQFILMGTTIAGESKIAFLLEKAGNKSRVVAQGKEINGITVRDVTADRIVLSQYGDTEELVLRTNKAPPGAPVKPAGVQGAAPFFGVPTTPAEAQAAKPPIGPPVAPAGAPGAATAPHGPPVIPGGSPFAAPPGGRRATPILPGSPFAVPNR